MAIKITPAFVLCSLPASATEPDFKSKDWVFLNYTYKRFEGLTQRGTIPTYMKAGKAWHAATGRRCVVERKQTFTDTGSGRGAPLVLRAAPSASQYTFNPHHTLFRSAQPPQEPPRTRKLRSVTALPRLFISYPRAVFSHSSQARSLTRTLNRHICMFSSVLLLGRIFLLPKGNIRNEDGIQITASTSSQW